MKNKIKILFLCTGNSCRSQMAEGWAEKLKADSIEAYSAGIKPIGVSSRAVKVMAEAGVDISNHKSKSIEELGIDHFDYVITLCDNARQSCPVFPGKAKIIHKPFKDPYFSQGSEENILHTFREVRDQIREYVKTLPESMKQEY